MEGDGFQDIVSMNFKFRGQGTSTVLGAILALRSSDQQGQISDIG
jgi:hypothetical protein